MKKAIYAAVAATIAAGSAVAHPVNEPHVCGIDPAMISEWPGYGTRGNIYDRGDYFFAVEVTDFQEAISYKHWNKVESITNHVRIYKDDCRVSDIEIVHPESEPEVELEAPPVEPTPEVQPETPPQLVVLTARGIVYDTGTPVTVDGYSATLLVGTSDWVDSDGNFVRVRYTGTRLAVDNYHLGLNRLPTQRYVEITDWHDNQEAKNINNDNRFTDSTGAEKQILRDNPQTYKEHGTRDETSFSIADFTR